MSTTNRLFTLLGAAAGGIVTWKLIAPEVLQHSAPVFVAGAGEGATALITGASAGIGEAFARRLAREGYNLVLVARREHKLTLLAEDLKARHGVTTHVVTADLADPNDAERLASTVTDLSEAGTLDLLINNAGFGTTRPFVEVPLQQQLDMIQLHATSSLQLTHAALPGMLHRRRGGIINVASVAGWYPLPGNVNYSATKRYLITFSQALQTELDGAGVFVQALCPGLTYSEFHDTPAYRDINFQRGSFPAFLWQTADQVVSASLGQLGSADPVCIPGVHNRAMVMLQGLVPRSAVREMRRRLGGLLG
jgi:short-subunit dehydrogenase